MNAPKPVLQDENYILKECKSFKFISNNIEYNALIKKTTDQICINISFENDMKKKEYGNYFSLGDIYSLNNEFSKYKSIGEFYMYFIKSFDAQSKTISIINNTLNLPIIVGIE